MTVRYGLPTTREGRLEDAPSERQCLWSVQVHGDKPARSLARDKADVLAVGPVATGLVPREAHSLPAGQLRTLLAARDRNRCPPPLYVALGGLGATHRVRSGALSGIILSRLLWRRGW